MSEYDERRAGLNAQIESAEGTLAALPAEQREAVGDELQRLEEALGFARIIVEEGDPRLVPEQTHHAIQTALTEISNNAPAVATNPAPYADQVIVAVSQLPAARGKLSSDKLKEVVANVQRSAQMRLHALEGQIAEAQRTFEGQRAELDAEVSALRSAIDAEKQRVESTTTEQAEHFRAAQEERATEFTEQGESFKAQLEELVKSSRAEFDQHVAEVKRMEEETAGLVGAISIAGSANRYGKVANEEHTAADFWRWGAVVTALLAVVPVLVAVIDGTGDTRSFLGKAAISLIILGAAKYMANQSALHRRREGENRDAEQDLAAFPPFIERLPEDKQVEATMVLADRTFGRRRISDSRQRQTGLGSFADLLRRRDDEEDE